MEEMDIEKARTKVQRNDGDPHPSNPNLVWSSSAAGGKGDWRKRKSTQQPQDGGTNQQPKKEDEGDDKKNQPQSGSTTKQPSQKKDLKDMTHKELVDWAKKTNEQVLSEIVNKKTIDTKARQVAYDELKERGSDVSKLDTDGIDLGHQKKQAKVQYKSAPAVDIKLPNSWDIKKPNGSVVKIQASVQAEKYAGLSDDNLLKILNNKSGNPYARHLAYEEAAARGIDETKIKTNGTLKDYWDKQERIQKMSGQQQSNEDEEDFDDGEVYEMNLRGMDIEAIMQQFPDGDEGWKDPNDPRIKKEFNNFVTLTDRQKYDTFLDYQKRQDPDYVKPVEQIQNLNAEYLDFLDGDASSFLISAGGAGVGKTWGFKKLCELLNLQKFDGESMKPGDADYDWVVAPNIKSEKQLNEFLAQHNGKIILFDDNDAILTRQDMKAVMKTVNDNDPESRLFRDPESGQMIKFTGKIACITNKSLDSLSADEDGKAVLSRAKKLEVKMTVNENLEILKDRYKSMTIDGLSLSPKEEEQAREEAYQFILDNQDKLDPAKFTVRKFRDIMLDIQSTKRREQFAGTSATAASLVGSKKQDWKKIAMKSLNKAQEDELNKEEDNESGYKKPTGKLKKKIDELRKKNPKLVEQLFGAGAADQTDSNSFSNPSDDEAEKALLNDFGMSTEEAESLLLG